jgi:predicted GNAT family acetyltransferase
VAPSHPLDRPVWSALTTRQGRLARGDDRAKRYAAEYGLFAAAADNSVESLASLADVVRKGGPVALVESAPPPSIAGMSAVAHLLWQMIAKDLTPAPAHPLTITRLGEADAPEMLALATLTRPGPFFSRTHQLGDFVGVRKDGVLIAMAGERMKVEGFTEISGVCTAPAWRGRGYAGALMREVAAGIRARGETPFLHAYASNTAAIGLYRSLGFELRRQVTMTELQRRVGARGGHSTDAS